MDVGPDSALPLSAASAAVSASSSASSGVFEKKYTDLEAEIAAVAKKIQTLRADLPSKWSLASLRISGSDPKKRLLQEKELEFQSLKSIKEKRDAIIAIFNAPGSQQDPASLLRAVYEANSMPGRAPSVVAGISVAHQTKIDIVDRAYTLTIDGVLFGKEQAVQALVSRVGPEVAQKILCITNQQLIISLVPHDTRNAAIYNALKSMELRPVAASEFSPVFRVDVADGAVRLTVEMHIWIRDRQDEKNVTLVRATLVVFHAEQLADSPVQLDYRLY